MSYNATATNRTRLTLSCQNLRCHFFKHFRHPFLSEAYHSVLKEDGLSGFENFKSEQETYSLVGDVRKIAAKPQDLTWKIVDYSSPDKDLLRTDLDVLNGKSEIQSDTKVQLVLPPSIKSPFSFQTD